MYVWKMDFTTAGNTGLWGIVRKGYEESGGSTASGDKWETIYVAIKNVFIIIKDTLRKNIYKMLDS